MEILLLKSTNTALIQNYNYGTQNDKYKHWRSNGI